ncbi:Rossmann-fold NAD(P)-binding domain-containing protein [Carnobacterium mobile]|uniref:NAD-dependent dehydratase n=1 Tax=Carnobacterium mobile TaxID=2750 RepID=UPI001868C8ED|nr:NAD-dependent dehydratase [Carnobacterium mobile]
MKKILVFGGTRFFGKKAVELLLEKNYEVTIATRGIHSDSFGDQVNRIIINRSDGKNEGWSTLQQEKWDMVVDNICFTKEDANLILEKLSGKIQRYFLTSTLAVYEGEKSGYSEIDFDPWNYQIDPEKEVTYGEGKRQAEAVLFQQASFPVGALRIPIVLDTDDYTERLHFYIRKVLQEKPIYFYQKDAKTSFIKGSEAAKAIVWLIENQKSGIYNASADQVISIAVFVDWLEESLAKKADVFYTNDQEKQSPFSVAHDHYLKVAKIEAEGFQTGNLIDWLKPLMIQLKKTIESEE